MPGPAFKAKRGRQAAGKGGLGCSGAALSREKAAGAGPEDAAGHWVVLVEMSNAQRSGFHPSGEFKHGPSLGVCFPRGESLLPSSRTNLPMACVLHPAAHSLGAALGLRAWRGKGRHRRLGAAQETLMSHSHLSPCHHLPEHLPKASADFHKGKHSLSMAPALSVPDHSVPRCPWCPCQAAGRCPVTMAMLPRFTSLPPSRFIPLPHFPPTLQTSGRVRMQLCHQGCGHIAGSPRSGVTALDLLSARGESWNQGADTDKSSAVSPR